MINLRTFPQALSNQFCQNKVTRMNLKLSKVKKTNSVLTYGKVKKEKFNFFYV